MSNTSASTILHMALTSKSAKVHPDELQVVAAALSKQLIRDFAPNWGIHGTVAAFTNPKSIPANYWPITIEDKIDEPGAAGYHSDEHNQPYSVIEWASDWPVTASHEVLEMVGDPWGNRLVTGVIKHQNARILREMCDPIESFQYAIDGVQVSDFLLPSYYGAIVDGAHYSFLNKLKAPLTIAHGGYLSYIVDGHWKQMTWFGGTSPKIRDLGLASARPSHMSLRAWVDENTRQHKHTLALA